MPKAEKDPKKPKRTNPLAPRDVNASLTSTTPRSPRDQDAIIQKGKTIGLGLVLAGVNPTSPIKRRQTFQPYRTPESVPRTRRRTSRAAQVDEQIKSALNIQPPQQQQDNFLIHVTLSETTSPTITRILSIPRTITFSVLNRILQAAFDWSGSHLHSFDVYAPGDKPYSAIPLVTMSPFDDDELAAAMGLEKGRVRNEAEVTVGEVWDGTVLAAFPPISTGVTTRSRANSASSASHPSHGAPGPRMKPCLVVYEYDHSVNWEHHITLLGTTTSCSIPQELHPLHLPSAAQTLCLAGQGSAASPAEDRGADGWREYKAGSLHGNSNEQNTPRRRTRANTATIVRRDSVTDITCTVDGDGQLRQVFSSEDEIETDHLEDQENIDPGDSNGFPRRGRYMQRVNPWVFDPVEVNERLGREGLWYVS